MHCHGNTITLTEENQTSAGDQLPTESASELTFDDASFLADSIGRLQNAKDDSEEDPEDAPETAESLAAESVALFL